MIILGPGLMELEREEVWNLPDIEWHLALILTYYMLSKNIFTFFEIQFPSVENSS